MYNRVHEVLTENGSYSTQRGTIELITGETWHESEYGKIFITAVANIGPISVHHSSERRPNSSQRYTASDWGKNSNRMELAYNPLKML